MFAVAKNVTLFASMFVVTTTALTVETGHFHSGILVVATICASAKYAVAAAHHAIFNRLEKAREAK